MNFSIVIPNYNGAELLPSCLESLFSAIKNCPTSKFEIVLIDNGSTDNSVLKIKKFKNSLKIENCKLKILRNPKNFGFAGAVNQGILSSNYKYVVVCNNDLTLNKDWFKIVSEVIKSNKDSKIITFFGLVLNKNGTKIESEGLEFFYKGKALNTNNGHQYPRSNIYNLPSIIWGASASLVVYKKDIITNIGMFDEDFFAYEEDVDLSLRLHTLGYKTLYIPTAISYHLGGGTSSKMGNFRNRMDAKNWIYIILKNYSTKEITTNLLPIIEERLRNLSGLIKNTPILLIPQSLLSTYCEVLLKSPKILKKRSEIKKLLKSTTS